MIGRILMAGLLLMGSVSVQAADGQALIQHFLKGLTTLKADFRQTLEEPEKGDVYYSTGTFYLKRPGQLRWEYNPPNDQLIVADGSNIWLYDRELEQVSHRGQKDALEGTPAQLLSATGPLDQHFKIESQGEEDGLQWVELLPKDKDAQFNKVRLALKDDKLVRMEMYDNFGQTTRFVFSDMQRNPHLDDKLFKFKPPPAVDVIGDL